MAGMDGEADGILRDMSVAAARTRKGARAKGRYARTPRFEAPAQRSTRPDMGGGTTFHFAHKAMSKRNDVSEGVGTMTSSSAHQGYIERREAGAQVDQESAAILEAWGKAGPVQEAASDSKGTSQEGAGNTDPVGAGTGADRARDAGFQAPPRHWSKDRTGFGTVGATTVERKAFWQKVEQAERRHGRVQSRIIAELPHEATPAERTKIALAFCARLEAQGLPYWAAIHAPTGKNDRRNHHLHIAYYDRPAGKNAQGVWDFEVVETKRKANRSIARNRPHQQPKSAAVRARSWVKTLRQGFAEDANTVLREGGYDKRLDPRSYREAGVGKEPTRHLGFKAHAMESFGLDTVVGVANAEKETRWAIALRTRRWERAMAVEDVAGLFDVDAFDGLSTVFDTRRARMEEGKAQAVLGAESDLLAERMTLRLDKRIGFLDKEGSRLLARGRGLRIAGAAQDIMAIDAERTALETREEEARQVAKALAEQARQARVAEARIWDELFGADTTRAMGTIGLGFDDTLDGNFWDIPGGDSPRLGLPSRADLRGLGAPSTPKDALPRPSAAEAMGIDWDNGMEDLDPLVEAYGQQPSTTAKTPDTPITRGTDAPPSNAATATPPKLGGEQPTPTKPPAAAQETATVPSRQTEDTRDPGRVAKAATQAGTRPFAMGIVADRDDGILLVGRVTQQHEVRALDAALRKMDNKETRMRAIATRDLVDVLEAGPLRDEANRAWVVLRAEAQRRGLDLETGTHDPKKGTDRERAALHRDQYLASVLEVRQEVISIRAR